jgi:hypothetical protein
MGNRTYDGHACVIGKKDWFDVYEMDCGESLIYSKKKQGTEYGALWNTITNWLAFGLLSIPFGIYFLNKIPTIY